MDESTRICPECGAPIPADGNFCTQCGAKYENNAANERAQREFAEMENEVKESRMNLVLILLVVYAIPATIAGLSSLIMSKQTADLMWQTESIREIFENVGWSYDFLCDYLLVSSILILAGGVLTAVSAAFTYKRKKWLVAFICCATASVFAITSLFGFLIGLLVSWMLYKSKDMFED